jgi:hypothetical protein
MKNQLESVGDTSATFYIDLPPKRFNHHSKSSGRAIIPFLFSLCLLLFLYATPGDEDAAIPYVLSIQDVLSFIAIRSAEWIPRLVSSLMLLYIGICLGYAGLRLYLELPKSSVRASN